MSEETTNKKKFLVLIEKFKALPMRFKIYGIIIIGFIVVSGTYVYMGYQSLEEVARNAKEIEEAKKREQELIERAGNAAAAEALSQTVREANAVLEKVAARAVNNIYNMPYCNEVKLGEKISSNKWNATAYFSNGTAKSCVVILNDDKVEVVF